MTKFFLIAFISASFSSIALADTYRGCGSALEKGEKVIVARSGYLENRRTPGTLTKIPCTVSLLDSSTHGYSLRFKAPGIFVEIEDPYAKEPLLAPDLSATVRITTLNPIGALATRKQRLPTGEYPNDYYTYTASLNFAADEAVLTEYSHITWPRQHRVTRKCIS